MIEELNEKGWHLTSEGIDTLTEDIEKATVSAVIKKALDTDLREIGATFISEDFYKSKAEFISGPCVLQIQKIRNVAAPKYDTYSNGPVLLRLYLSDGITTVSCIQCGHYRSISIDTPPGTKIFLKNTKIPFQKGFLLLSESHFTVLGGNVSALVRKWELSKHFASHMRRSDGSDDAPPPWTPFGKAILTSKASKGDFKSLEQENKEEKEDEVFTQQRQANIAEVSKTKEGRGKVFGGGKEKPTSGNGYEKQYKDSRDTYKYPQASMESQSSSHQPPSFQKPEYQSRYDRNQSHKPDHYNNRDDRNNDKQQSYRPDHYNNRDNRNNDKNQSYRPNHYNNREDRNNDKNQSYRSDHYNNRDDRNNDKHQSYRSDHYNNRDDRNNDKNQSYRSNHYNTRDDRNNDKNQPYRSDHYDNRDNRNNDKNQSYRQDHYNNREDRFQKQQGRYKTEDDRRNYTSNDSRNYQQQDHNNMSRRNDHERTNHHSSEQAQSRNYGRMPHQKSNNNYNRSGNYKKGQEVLARYWEDKQLYYAIVHEVGQNGTCVVHFVEYGNHEEVNITDIFPYTDKESNSHSTSSQSQQYFEDKRFTGTLEFTRRGNKPLPHRSSNEEFSHEQQRERPQKSDYRPSNKVYQVPKHRYN